MKPSAFVSAGYVCAQAVRCGRIIQQWILGIEDFDENDVIDLKNEWVNFLVPAQNEERINEMWQHVEKMKTLVSG